MIVDLLSPLPRAECAKRLHQHISSEWSLITGSGVVGSIDGDRLQIRKRILYRNSFQTRLRAQLSDTEGGTRIHCEAGGNFPLLPVIVGIAVLVVALSVMTIVLLASRGIHLSDLPPIALIAPPAGLLFAVGLTVGVVRLGGYLSKGDTEYLLGFLRRTLDAN